MSRSLDARPWYRRIHVDRFVLAIICAAALASVLPVHGSGSVVLGWATKALIFVLFYLYGVRLEPREAIDGLKHWRLHLTILASTYLVFPLIVLAARPMLHTLISPQLFVGVLWLSILPSTVQSSINFTSIAKGNVAGAIVSASLSNILGVVLTPLLAMFVMRTGGLVIEPASILDLFVQLLLPFILGQLTRRWTKAFVLGHPKLKYVDQLSIVTVVYNAFSDGMNEGVWHSVGFGDIARMLPVLLALLGLMLVLTWWVPGRLGFDRRDQIAIQFCGTKKSLATGVPMASVLFASATVPLLVLPLMIFHMSQLIVCGVIAGRYQRKPASWFESPGERQVTV
ncbi:solute carrier family 10 (sodium/bile acid cotransporter), member 7 [Propionibacterium cyclohexanicum]|uniref:Solute carrier family 10 (Sodium/bile acid cotransporter), member 7 n=1 Tax=Propionibacterium cyclohexanicum TaxID=64702 RepID=A0A1H9PP64_9ACTN|nr:bile acid:sodium symporter family protein [Propionibacterium cyclohexanicum]SER49353.1 solute carrier family 10 (sodium/bile acid cotransporter), member 7 [Propionibacterium cyclohexanicum]